MQTKSAPARPTAAGRRLLEVIGHGQTSFFDEGIVARSGIWHDNLTGETAGAVGLPKTATGVAGVVRRLIEQGYLDSQQQDDGVWVWLTETGAAAARSLAADTPKPEVVQPEPKPEAKRPTAKPAKPALDAVKAAPALTAAPPVYAGPVAVLDAQGHVLPVRAAAYPEVENGSCDLYCYTCKSYRPCSSFPYVTKKGAGRGRLLECGKCWVSRIETNKALPAEQKVPAPRAKVTAETTVGA
jgi:hypothetical protein